MPDPTTANKALAKPINGTDVGTWDVPVNGNMDIIDASFAGTATIGLTNVPVTLNSAQYRNQFIVFTGALSGNVTVTFPAIGSFYTILNQCTNSSAFLVTLSNSGGGQHVGCPPQETFMIATDTTNVRFLNLGDRVGAYWDYAGSSVPGWVSGCSVPPYLNCDGSTFSAVTYPQLAIILGGTTLPDSRGRNRMALNQGTGRVTTGNGGVDGNTPQAAGGNPSVTLSSGQMPPIPVSDPGHRHQQNYTNPGTAGGGFNAGLPVSSGPNLDGFTEGAFTGITAGNASPSAVLIMNPTYVGGLTLIRAG